MMSLHLLTIITTVETHRIERDNFCIEDCLLGYYWSRLWATHL
jgi:hypothetical protein